MNKKNRIWGNICSGIMSKRCSPAIQWWWHARSRSPKVGHCVKHQASQCWSCIQGKGPWKLYIGSLILEDTEFMTMNYNYQLFRQLNLICRICIQSYPSLKKRFNQSIHNGQMSNRVMYMIAHHRPLWRFTQTHDLLIQHEAYQPANKHFPQAFKHRLEMKPIPNVASLSQTGLTFGGKPMRLKRWPTLGTFSRARRFPRDLTLSMAL